MTAVQLKAQHEDKQIEMLKRLGLEDSKISATKEYNVVSADGNTIDIPF